MVLMFMAPSLYARACSASQNALPAAGRHQAAFQISPHSSKSRYRNALRWNRASTERSYARPMPTPLTSPALERVLQGRHDSEIRYGIQNEPPAGGITAWIDFGDRTEKVTFYGTGIGDQQVWPAADSVAAWLHETAMRLFPDSPYAKSHNG
jgi:hypothetical protein